MSETVARVRYLLDEMDRENMPNQRRAEIIVAATGALVTDDDREWANRLAKTLPSMPKEARDGV